MTRCAFLCCIFLGFSCLGNGSELLDFDKHPVSQSTYGGIGLIETPTARFSNDGEFAFGISTEIPWNRLYSKVQFFPWLEVVLRYTEGTHKPYQPGMTQTWKDKGIDLKVRLSEEGDRLPALAFGLTDFGGTAAFASEYIVANKRFNNLDFTLGIGWGQLGGTNSLSNPLKWLSNFLDAGEDSALGGRLNLGRVFMDEEPSIFGGIEYYTPISNLSVKLEYDSSDYAAVTGLETHINRTGDLWELGSRFNFAANYRFNLFQRDKIDLQIGYLRGNTFYANIAIHSNLNFEGKPKYIAPPEILNQPYLQPFEELNPDWQRYLTELIIWQMGNEGIVTHNLIFKGDEMQVEISQGRFQNPIQAIDLASRILGNNSPTNIDRITVINIDSGIETLRASIPRETLVEVVANGPLDAKYLDFNSADSDNYVEPILRKNEYIYPNFFWSVQPHLTGTLQHQVRFYFWQLEALLHTELAFKKGLYLTTDVGIDIANNFDTYSYHIPDGELHHVRQDRRRYLTEGETGLRRMSLEYLTAINSNITARMTVGIIEWMYGGIGGEVLYMPDDKNWALGVDAYWVKQREFDQKFSFRDYQTVTGFVNFYYDLPFYDLRFKASMGKFLGKDTGVDVDISRRFQNGARVGAKVALTNCDAACVGEGSFNKWVYFSLPTAIYSRGTDRGQSGYSWSPLTKDAGQKVGAGSLFGLMTDATDEVDSFRRKPWSIKKILSGFGTTSKKKT